MCSSASRARSAATPRSQRRLFLLLGLGIGLVGSLIGAVLGTAISLVLDATGALPLPRGVFFVSSVPFRLQPLTVVVVMAAALLLATEAGSYLTGQTIVVDGGVCAHTI